MGRLDLETNMPLPAGETVWLVAEWILLAVWFTAAIVTMYPGLGRALYLSGGLFSSYGADLTFPAWFYIQLRRRPLRMLRWIRWLGGSPELAAVSIFVVGLVAEISQLYWPRGIFRGTFDPFDIAAYGVSLLVCYSAEQVTPS
ncbi:MAG: hypothetical protein JNL98_30710 [Bryobacterales bacterium]|nr:hypothetical protein [Bryobacterales bacterium]